MLELKNFRIRCKGRQGGIKTFYLLPYVKYSRSQIKTEDLTLTYFPTSDIYEFKVAGNYTQTSNTSGAGFHFDQTINLQLGRMYDLLNPHIFLEQDFRVIVETNNHEIFMFGLQNGMECKVSNSSGTDKAGFNGFQLDFSGKEERLAFQIDDLDALGLNRVLDENLLNQNFNFLI